MTDKLINFGLVGLCLYAYFKWCRGRPFPTKEQLKEAFDRKPGAPEGMRFVHDCDVCVPIEKLGPYDVYVCPQNGYPTVVARYGDDGPEYESSPTLSLKANNVLYDFDARGEALVVHAHPIVV